MRTTLALLCLLTVTLAAQAPDTIDARAARLHKAAIVVDTHIDTTPMLGRPGWDFMTRHAARTAGAGRGAEPDTSHVDSPRMREGGLDAAFFSRPGGSGDAGWSGRSSRSGGSGGSEVVLKSADDLPRRLSLCAGEQPQRTQSSRI